MTGTSKNLIVFTDLDGTLLDHETYSYAAAGYALAQLEARAVPLILASSKTASEIAPLRSALGFEHCEAIVENGAGILEPHASAEDAGDDHQRLCAALADLPAHMRGHFTGFSDWSVEEVAKRTHLPLDQARAAKQRQFSEPGLWSGDEATLQAFLTELESRSITAQQGGRFLTLSFGSNKAQRMVEIIGRYSKPEAKAFALALGDAGNDIGMLEAADLGVIIPNPAHGGIERLAGEDSGQIIRAQSAGPAGWNHAVLNVLNAPAGN